MNQAVYIRHRTPLYPKYEKSTLKLDRQHIMVGIWPSFWHANIRSLLALFFFVGFYFPTHFVFFRLGFISVEIKQQNFSERSIWFHVWGMNILLFLLYFNIIPGLVDLKSKILAQQRRCEKKEINEIFPSFQFTVYLIE